MYCQSCGAYNPGENPTCLNCRQPLPGRGAPPGANCRVHPEVAAAGTCGRCGTFACANCLRPVGAQFWCEACVETGTTLPWDERESIGVWRAFWRTAVAMLTQPQVTLSTAKADAPLGSSALFSTLAFVVGFGPTMAVYAFIVLVAGLSLAGVGKGEGAFAVFLPVALATAALSGTLGHLAVLFFYAGLDHLTLLILGEKPRAYPVSVRVNALAMAPYLVGLVPFCGLYVMPIWSLVLRVLGVMHLHRVSAGKATAVVLLPVVVLCGLCGLLYVGIFMLAGLGAAMGK